MPSSLSGVAALLMLGLAGATGAAARFALSEWATKRWPGTFPLATLLINVTGAFALGLLMTAGGAGSALAQERLLLGTGFLGGYTTFSTLSYDTHSLYRSGQSRAAWLNALGSLAIGLAAAALGIAIGTLV
jgi:CrcB protein